jgi:hypothetical protein
VVPPGVSRTWLLAGLARLVESRTMADRVLRVAIDGPDAAGRRRWLRAELRDHWDLRIFVDVGPEEALRRALVRDVDVLGSAADVHERYRRRYLPAQRIYRTTASPESTADVVIDNTDPARPCIRVWPGR